MDIVSVINYKGGVGKTTVTANLAAELAWRNYNVLVIDLDPQCSLTFSFIKPDEWEKDYSKDKTINSWFDSLAKGDPIKLESLIFTPPAKSRYLNNKGQLEIIASHLGLINVDLELATELGGSSLAQAKRRYLKVHGRLNEGLKELNPDRYDIVLIDCPPNFNIVTKNAIVASNYVLIPAKPDYLSTLGIDYLKRSLHSLIKDYNEYAELDHGANEDTISPEILGVLFTMVQIYGGQPISSIRPYMSQTKQLDIPVFESYIRENKTIFADAPQYGVPVVLLSTSPKSHKEVVEGIEEFVSEFIEELNMEK